MRPLTRSRSPQTENNPLYHPLVPVPGATIRATPGDLEPLPARISAAAPGAGPAVLAAELLGRVTISLALAKAWS